MENSGWNSRLANHHYRWRQLEDSVAGKSSTVWAREPHTEAKHIILRKYLDAWLPILTKYNERVIFCDGFAGPGAYSGGEEGSPIIALKAFLEHSYRPSISAEIQYLFIEADAERCEALRQAVRGLSIPNNVHVEIRNDEYEISFGNILDKLEKDGHQLAPMLVFIDPFGIKGISLEVVKRIMSNSKCEVLITYMIGSTHRFIETPEFEDPCDQLFGCTDWRDAKSMSGRDREEFLRQLYYKQLKELVGAKYVRSFTMKNKKNRTIYDLFFITNSAKGIDAMKAAMWNVDQTGAYSFSDATDPGQQTLFSNHPPWDQLFEMLRAEFAGKEVRWPLVEEAIRRTPFRILKRPLKAAAKGSDAPFHIVYPGGANSGAINNQTIFRFTG